VPVARDRGDAGHPGRDDHDQHCGEHRRSGERVREPGPAARQFQARGRDRRRDRHPHLSVEAARHVPGVVDHVFRAARRGGRRDHVRLPVIRRGVLSLRDLYTEDGIYTYVGGVNRHAVVALVAGIVVALAGLTHPGLRFLFDGAWFSATAMSFVVYWFLMWNAEVGTRN